MNENIRKIFHSFIHSFIHSLAFIKSLFNKYSRGQCQLLCAIYLFATALAFYWRVILWLLVRMLRSLLIINHAGLVIFIRSWIPLGLIDEVCSLSGDRASNNGWFIKEKELIRMGSVFHALQDQSKQSTRCTPTYIEFTTGLVDVL